MSRIGSKTLRRLASAAGDSVDQGSASSDLPEDFEFQREVLKLSPMHRSLVAALVRHISELERVAGPDVADATLDRLVQVLRGQPAGLSS